MYTRELLDPLVSVKGNSLWHVIDPLDTLVLVKGSIRSFTHGFAQVDPLVSVKGTCTQPALLDPLVLVKGNSKTIQSPQQFNLVGEIRLLVAMQLTRPQPLDTLVNVKGNESKTGNLIDQEQLDSL